MNREQAAANPHFSQAKIRFQSFFMLMTNQPFVLGFVVEGLREGADLRVRQSVCRAVGVFADGVIVQHDHHQRCAAAGLGVLQHLLVSGGIPERYL